MIRTKVFCWLTLLSLGCADLQEIFGSILHGGSSGGVGSAGSGGYPAPDSGAPPEPPPPTCDAAVMDIDALYAMVSADLGASPAAARPFTRYVSAANDANAGSCASLTSAGPL
jgi:hypothetical protein